MDCLAFSFCFFVVLKLIIYTEAITDSEPELVRKLNRWKDGLEKKGMTVLQHNRLRWYNHIIKKG